MTEAALTFRDLTLGYGGHPAVHHLDGTLARGALTALVGSNGSGKSTLLKGIAGLLKPLSGAIERRPGLSVAWLAQLSELDRTFPVRVVDLVMLGLWPRRGLLGRITRQDRAAVGAALAAVGLAGFEERPIDTLSGGQFQRALFARLMVQDGDVILLDEPFNAVDARTVADLLVLIRRWHAEGRTVLVALHDMELVRAHFPETLLLARRPVAWGPTAGVLTPENLGAARRFAEAWQDDAPWCEPGPDASHDHHAPDGHDHRPHGDHGRGGHVHPHVHARDGQGGVGGRAA